MNAMPDIIAKFTDSINFEIPLGQYSFRPALWQAIAIVVLLFLLIITLASMRRHFITWSFKGAAFGLFFGFLLALILEGFLIIGGKTAITEMVGWKNAPKPLLVVLEAGRSKLVNVLGIADEIPTSNAEGADNAGKVIDKFQSLSPADAGKVREMICPK
jgi:hypothetical protein